MPCRDSGLPHDTRNIVGTSGNVFFERLLAREGRAFTIFNSSKNLASSSQELGPGTTGTCTKRESEMRRESMNASIPSLHSQIKRWYVDSYWWNLFSQWMVEYPLKAFLVRTCAVFFVRHELSWFCLVQVSTTQFCSVPSFLMASVDGGSDVPFSNAWYLLRIMVRTCIECRLIAFPV